MDLSFGTSAWATDDRQLTGAVWPYFRFPFGLSMKEELARARGIIIGPDIDPNLSATLETRPFG